MLRAKNSLAQISKHLQAILKRFAHVTQVLVYRISLAEFCEISLATRFLHISSTPRASPVT